MRFGICCDIDKLELCLNSGADFIEVNNTKIAQACDEEFNDALLLSKKHPNTILASNGLIPKTIRLTGNDVDYDKIVEFCESSFERLSLLGVKILVFGSSGAKRVPEGFSFELAMQQLVRCVRIFSDVAKRYDQIVVIEPLRYSECNIINLMRESKELADLVDRDNVKAHVDFFHMMQNQETFTELQKFASDFVHAHIASPVLRTLPAFDDGANYKEFLDILKNANPDLSVSFEGSTKFEENELKTMFSFLKSL